MRKLAISGLVAVMTLFIAMLATPRAEAYVSPVQCISKTAHSYGTNSVPADPGEAVWKSRTMYTHTAVWYKSCRNKLGPDFIRPYKIRIDIDVAGSRMSCGNSYPWGDIRKQGGWVRTLVTPYFWDSYGRNFKMRAFSLPCQTDTTSTVIRDIGTRTSVPLYPNKVKFRSYMEHVWSGRNNPTSYNMGQLRF